MELPAVIPDTNALERDTVYRFEWKLSRNLENVSLFAKCKFPAKADNDAKVDSSHPVNPRKKKKKPPSARRQARRRQQRFLEKKAAEKATSPIWITRHRVFPFRLLYKRSRKFSRISLQLILTATTILMTQEFVLTVTVNQNKVPNSSGAPAVTSPDIVALTVNGRTGDFPHLPSLLLPKELQ